MADGAKVVIFSAPIRTGGGAAIPNLHPSVGHLIDFEDGDIFRVDVKFVAAFITPDRANQSALFQVGEYLL